MYGQTFITGAVRGGRTSYARHRGTRSTRSGQTVVYPACSTEHEAIQCVFFLNDNATKIMGLTGEGVSSVVWVSCAATLQDIMAGSGRGVFAPDAGSKSLPGAKYYLPGFCITLRRDHYFTTVDGAHHMELAGAYQAQFHWHEGASRLTLDPVS